MQPVPVPYSETINEELTKITKKVIKENKLFMSVTTVSPFQFLCLVKKEDKPETALPVHLFREPDFFNMIYPPRCTHVLADFFFQFALATEAGDVHKWLEIAEQAPENEQAKILYNYVLSRLDYFFDLIGEKQFDEMISEIRATKFFKERIEKQ